MPRKARAFRYLWVAVAVMAAACASTQARKKPPDPQDPAVIQLSRGYALLYELVSKQTGLSKALIRGGVNEEGKALIHEITAESRDAAEKIKGMAKTDPSINLDDKGLPKAEEKARDLDESWVTGHLLFSSGRFELRLMLSQIDATEYGAFLAKATAGIEKDDSRKKWLKDFADRYMKFRDRIEDRLALKGEK